MNILTLLIALACLVLLLIVLLPMVQRRGLELRRAGGLERLGRARGSRVLALIAHEEATSIAGLVWQRRHVVADSAAVIRAITQTAPKTPIDLILHLGPGDATAAEQIAHALVRHPARVTVFVPCSALGSSTLIALAADEIVLDPSAVLGPVSPTVGTYPAVALLRAAQERGIANLTDQFLVLLDPAQKAVAQVRALIRELLLANDPERAGVDDAADQLAGLTWTPAYPILFEEAQRLGLPVSDQVPTEVYALMELYDTAATHYATTAFVNLDLLTGGR